MKNTDTTPFYPGEVIWGSFPAPPEEEPSIKVVELDHLDPEAIPVEDAVALLQAHGIPCKLRFLVGKKPRAIRLLKLPDVAHIPCDKRGYVPFPLIQHIITEIGRFEAQHKAIAGTDYEYLIDKKPPHDNDA